MQANTIADKDSTHKLNLLRKKFFVNVKTKTACFFMYLIDF
jgi:hypothetical protein